MEDGGGSGKLAQKKQIDWQDAEIKLLEEAVKPSIRFSEDEYPHRDIYYVEIFSQVTLHRFLALFDGMKNAWVAGNGGSAIILGRAVMEVAAVAIAVSKTVGKCLSDADIASLHEPLGNQLFGTRLDSDKLSEIPRIPNILNRIDAMGRATKLEARNVYDWLSEHCHPNYPAMIGMFALEVEEEGNEYQFGFEYSTVESIAHQINLCASFAGAYRLTYEYLVSVIPDLKRLAAKQ